MDSQRKDRSDGPPIACRTCRQGFPTQKRMMLVNIALKTFPGGADTLSTPKITRRKPRLSGPTRTPS